jgi:hypothetical protein
MCEYISHGNYEAALTKTAASNLEVINLKQLDAWTDERWGICGKVRLNSPEKTHSHQGFYS